MSLNSAQERCKACPLRPCKASVAGSAGRDCEIPRKTAQKPLPGVRLLRVCFPALFLQTPEYIAPVLAVISMEAEQPELRDMEAFLRMAKYPLVRQSDMTIDAKQARRGSHIQLPLRAQCCVLRCDELLTVCGCRRP